MLRNGLPRSTSLATCAMLAAVLYAAARGSSADTIRIWKVGSPHTGDVPSATAPVAMINDFARQGLHAHVEAFPADGFAVRFLDAITRRTTPDLLVFDNFGVMSGITTERGKFDGIAEDPAVKDQLIRVTGAFDALLGPTRGWTYLFAQSANYGATRALALRSPNCPKTLIGPPLPDELAALVPALGAAYLQEDSGSLQAYADPDRLPAVAQGREAVSVKVVRPCGVLGNDKLAFASAIASYEADHTIGQKPVLLVFRKVASTWRLLVAARDPISNGEFVSGMRSMARALARRAPTSPLPAPATLLSPVSSTFPQASGDERFGSFNWRSSPSAGVVAEIVEFAYHDDARLFISPSARRDALAQLSAGRLWTTGSLWSWRVWSVTSAGDVVFSDVWTFPH